LRLRLATSGEFDGRADAIVVDFVPINLMRRL